MGRGTLKDVGADLHVNPETLRTWMHDASGRPASAGHGGDDVLVVGVHGKAVRAFACLGQHRQGGDDGTGAPAGSPSRNQELAPIVYPRCPGPAPAARSCGGADRGPLLANQRMPSACSILEAIT